jgi:hypothetical protein
MYAVAEGEGWWRQCVCLWLLRLLGGIVLADAAQLVSLVGFALGPFSVYVESVSVAKTALQAMGVDVVMGIPPSLVIQL